MKCVKEQSSLQSMSKQINLNDKNWQLLIALQGHSCYIGSRTIKRVRSWSNTGKEHPGTGSYKEHSQINNCVFLVAVYVHYNWRFIIWLPLYIYRFVFFSKYLSLSCPALLPDWEGHGLWNYVWVVHRYTHCKLNNAHDTPPFGPSSVAGREMATSLYRCVINDFVLGVHQHGDKLRVVSSCSVDISW
jgi:hypothetical protein